ncbi:MAG TPA: HEAT repeat domain-containing protein, partial [Blastocatellia bacterium]|nr:HEAT repeat domain-containing protein [Blastocatellia bacterium]
RAQAAHALGVNGPAAARAVPALINMLTSDKAPEARRQAAIALGHIGERAALPALEEAKFSADPYLSQAALAAIASLKAEQ